MEKCMNAMNKTRLVGSLIAVLWLALPQPSGAQSLDAPAPARTPADLNALESLAAAGDLKAQVELGVIYYDGQEGVRPDDAKAVAWFRRAAQAGSFDGQMLMGLAYEYGRGVPKDLDPAAARYERGSAGGHPRALDRQRRV